MFKKKTKPLYVILNRIHLKKDFFKKNIDIFTLNKYVLNERERQNINHYYPDPNKTAFDSELLLKKTHEVKNEINKKISKIKIFQNINYIDELLDTFLEIKLSTFFYLFKAIPEYKEYILINKNKKYNFNSKVELILNIEKYSSERGNSLFIVNKFNSLSNPSINNILLRLQLIIFKRLLHSSNKNFYLFSDKGAYYIDYLKSKFINEKNIVINFHPSINYLRIFFIIFDQLCKLFINKKFREISFFLLPVNLKMMKKYKVPKSILNIRFLDKNYSKILFEQIYGYLYNYIFLKKYLRDCFNEKEIKNSFFHSIRLPELHSLSNVLIDLGNEVSLISHGSHTRQIENEIDFISSKNIGLGLCYSLNKKITLLSQSIYCDHFLDSINKNYSKINFIISKKKNESEIKKCIKNNPKTKILLIGSIKPLGARRYYYESSSEFISSIYLLYEKLYKFKDKFEIHLNIRNVSNEINNNILNNAFKELKDLIYIKTNIPLENEIENCDCIISYCSTVLEEGLHKDKPVMCFGLSNYNHFKYYERLVQNDKIILKKDLRIIENLLDKTFVYQTKVKRKLNYKF